MITDQLRVTKTEKPERSRKTEKFQGLNRVVSVFELLSKGDSWLTKYFVYDGPRVFESEVVYEKNEV